MKKSVRTTYRCRTNAAGTHDNLASISHLNTLSDESGKLQCKEPRPVPLLSPSGNALASNVRLTSTPTKATTSRVPAQPVSHWPRSKTALARHAPTVSRLYVLAVPLHCNGSPQTPSGEATSPSCIRSIRRRRAETVCNLLPS